MNELTREQLAPTHERMAKERMYRTDAGSYRVEFFLCCDFLAEFGHITDVELTLCEEYAHRQEVARHFMGVKVVDFDTEEGRILPQLTEDERSMIDEYRDLHRILSGSQIDIVDFCVQPIMVNSNMQAMRRGYAPLHQDIRDAMSALAKAFKEVRNGA